MSGYTIILSPICSIMIVDYWLVKRGKIDIPALYRVDGRYYYWNGINWRAALALLCTIPLGLPGLIGTVNTKIDVGKPGVHLFDISYIMEVRNIFAHLLSLVQYSNTALLVVCRGGNSLLGNIHLIPGA